MAMGGLETQKLATASVCWCVAGLAASGHVLHTLSRAYRQNRGCCQMSPHKPWEKASFYIVGEAFPWVGVHSSHKHGLTEE